MHRWLFFLLLGSTTKFAMPMSRSACGSLFLAAVNLAVAQARRGFRGVFPGFMGSVFPGFFAPRFSSTLVSELDPLPWFELAGSPFHGRTTPLICVFESVFILQIGNVSESRR